LAGSPDGIDADGFFLPIATTYPVVRHEDGEADRRDTGNIRGVRSAFGGNEMLSH